MKQKTHAMEADTMKEHLDKKRKTNKLTEETKEHNCSSNQGPQRTKREKQINFSKASWNLASCKIKDASDFLVHTQLEVPRGIMCLQEFPAKHTNWIVAQTMFF